MKFENVKKTVENYAKLNEEDRSVVDRKIEKAWQSMSKEFARMCKDDVECESLRKQLWDIHAIQSFVLVKVVSDFISERIPGDDVIPQDIQEKIYEEFKYRHDNLAELNKELNDEIERLESKRFVINREKRIKKLKYFIDYNNEVSEFYEYCEEMEEKRAHYNKNYKELVEPLEKRYKEIIRKYAGDVLGETIKQTPELVCKEHKHVVCGCLNREEGKTLNERFSEFRESLLEQIKEAQQEEKKTLKTSRSK